MKKVLVISYYYPPMGMGGVQRTAKFTKYLSRYGWVPHVLTVNQTYYLASDEHLLKEVESSGVIIHRTGVKTGDNGSHEGGQKVVKFKKDSNRKLLSNISQTFLIPDSKVLWKNKAIALAEKIINTNSIDLIFATAPPYTDFLIAVYLKEKFGLPIVLDYRDSWIDCPNNFYPTPFHKRRHMKLEKNVLRHADGITTMNERVRELIIERYPFVTEDIIRVISHGFDPEDFEKVSGETPSNDKFRITYSGSFLNYYTPKHFFDALRKVLDEKPVLRGKIEAMFVGTFPEEFKKYADDMGISDVLKFTGYVPHTEVMKHLMQSHVLWMMINQTGRSDLHSTGKLYEYFGARKPIIACVPEGVARESLKNYGAVKITEPDDVNSIAEAIKYFYSCFETNSLPVPNPEFILKYDRNRLSGELAEIFNNISAIEPEKVKI
jgi:glycosyltransferase involved in cell wall biosynthesis